MWDGCQEGWTHAVPRCSDASVGRHPVSGLLRYSLTFRMKRTDIPELPRCCCGEPAALRANRGSYVFVCDPSRTRSKSDRGSAQCGFWQRCEWAELEAARLCEQSGRAILPE
uniref:Uncharacterized protein n=1 Tax=Coccolithus braarudii TaxID=221442 RepID=A0A7S0QA00_9EUKA